MQVAAASLYMLEVCQQLACFPHFAWPTSEFVERELK